MKRRNERYAGVISSDKNSENFFVGGDAPNRTYIIPQSGIQKSGNPTYP
jgi:hypothetical protein